MTAGVFNRQASELYRSDIGCPMGKYNADILSFDEDRKVIEFDIGRPRKITGSRIAAILGMNEYTTPFKAACEMVGLWKEPPSKFTEAGNVMEPKIRGYVRDHAEELIGEALGGGRIDVEDPVPARECGFEHFPGKEPFGGMVDGYVTVDGKRAAVLEIKTASRKDGWFGTDGSPEVPFGYVLQASLYCELSDLDRIVFAAGFPEASDYEDPESWEPCPENTAVRIVSAYPMRAMMEEAVAWYNRYIRRGITPPWTDRDTELVDALLSRY